MIDPVNKPAATYVIPPEDEAAYIAAVQEGVEAADAGRLSAFEPVAEWLAFWGTETELPPPK